LKTFQIWLMTFENQHLKVNQINPSYHKTTRQTSQSIFIYMYAIYKHVLIYIKKFFFWSAWGLNSGLHTCNTGALPFEPRLQSILLLLFWRWGFENYLFMLAQYSNDNPPYLSLPKS
jgi:hypothetical protein